MSSDRTGPIGQPPDPRIPDMFDRRFWDDRYTARSRNKPHRIREGIVTCK
jgi:hypothetical protein